MNESRKDVPRTADEFEARYAARSGPWVTVEFLHAQGWRAEPCHCGEDDCEGWAMGPTTRKDTR